MPLLIVLQRSIEEAFHFREIHDLVEFPVDFRFAHAQDGATHIHIFAAGELGVETGADFEKAADAAVKLRVSFGGAGDAGQDFQQRAFAGAVAADQAHHFAFFYLEIDVLQGPDVGRAAVRVPVGALVAVRVRARNGGIAAEKAKRRAQGVADQVSQRSVLRRLADAVALTNFFNLYHRPAHHLIIHFGICHG